MDLASSHPIIPSVPVGTAQRQACLGKTYNLTSILCRDWQRIDLRTLSKFPFIAFSTIKHTQLLPFYSKHILSELAAIHKSFVSDVHNMFLLHLLPEHQSNLNTGKKNVRFISKNNCFICIHTESAIRNEGYYLYRGSQIIYFLFTWPLDTKVSGSFLSTLTLRLPD